jgi:NADH:ubiquinone oxidoreductase subunit F (NADH-binding)
MAFDAVSYLQAQSCGKCVFCREGTLQMADILKGIVEQTGTVQDLELLEELAGQMRLGCLCALGREAPNAVLSSMRLFRDEYDGHLKGKGCAAKAL